MAKAVRWTLLIGILGGVLILSALSGMGITRQAQEKQAASATPGSYAFYLPVVSRAGATALTLGYYTGTQGSYDAVQSLAPYLSIVSADVFGVQLDGSIVGGDEFDVVAYDRAHGLRTYACIANYNNDPDVNDFDPALAHAAIVTHKDAVIADLVALARDGGYDGVNIDFESLAYSADIAEDRAAFSAFIHDLAAQLHAQELKLAISVPGKTEHSAQDAWSYPFDYAALGRDADYLQLMTYDQHGPWGEPGPVSGADWVEACVIYAASLVDPDKLLIGLPAYGYDWDLTASDPGSGSYTASSFSWTDIPTLLAKPGAALQWDAAAQSPAVTYTEGGHVHEAWYENAESLRAKTALVTRYKLAGLSMWSLGQEDESFWVAATDF